MKAYKGFKSEKSGTAYPQLPAGAYVAAIQNVKIVGTEPDQQLVLRLEIIEGEWAGYFTKRYQNDASGGGQYEVKYKGDMELQIPNDDNHDRQHPEWDERTFNNFIYCIQASNPGYTWDWKENGLKGKTIGVSAREEVWNGNTFTKLRRLEVADDVRKGLVKPMRPKTDNSSLPQNTPAETTTNGFTMVETEELPF